MDYTRGVVYGTIGVVVAVALVSGPLVPGVEVTGERTPEEVASPGSGTAEVAVLGTPDAARLVRGRYGAGSYYLRVPDATVRLDAVRGNPLLVYKLRVPDLGHTRSTVHFLGEREPGPANVSVESSALDPDRVEGERYRGELLLVVRDDAGERTLVRRNVTVDVER